MAGYRRMPARLVSIDHDTPMLLPPDLRDWVPEDHLVHFIMEAVGLLDVSAARINAQRKQTTLAHRSWRAFHRVATAE